MELTPEERRKIYQEEKARIEAEEKKLVDAGSSSTGLKPNVAGLLCYLAGWITGIIFLIIEQKNRFVRFHAIQSIITFGALTIASALLGWIPIVGGLFGAVIGITGFVLWIVLMVKAYQGELYKLPAAGDIAIGIMGTEWQKEKEIPREEQAAESRDSIPLSKKIDDLGKRMDNYFKGSRTGRIIGYSIAIFWNIAALIFFSFFYKYIAWYHIEPDGTVTRMPFLTGDYFIWLSLLVTAIVINITANIIMIVYDRYWLRGIIHIILDLISIIVIANLVAIFPFDFSAIPNATAADVVPVALTIFLIVIAVLLGISVLVQFVKLIVNVSRQSPD